MLELNGVENATPATNFFAGEQGKDMTRQLEDIINELGELPPLPEVVSDLLKLTQSQTTPLEEIRRVILRDPILAGRVLQLSNSPLYGMHQRIGSLKLALVILGAREVRNLVLGISAIDLLSDAATEAQLAQGFLAHAALVGGLARNLTQELKLRTSGEEFSAGLLHDIGKIVLGRHFAKEYMTILEHSSGDSSELCKRELETFGFTHADASAALLAFWDLPSSLCDAVQLHHFREDRPLNQAAAPRLASLVRIANLAAHDDFNSTDADAWISSTEVEAWEILDLDGKLDKAEQRSRVLMDVFSSFPKDMPPLFSNDLNDI